MISPLKYALTAMTVATVPVISSVVSTPPTMNTAAIPSTTTTGIVRALMTTEPGENGASTLGFVLDTGATKVELPSNKPPSALPGTRLTMDGGIDSVESGEAVITATAVPSTRKYAPIAARNLVVVPVTWEDAPFTESRLAELRTALTQLDSWWSSASSGIENLSIKTLPVTSIPIPDGCDYLAMETAAKAVVSMAGLSSWATNISVIVPTNSGCWWGGLGEMPGFTTWIKSIRVMVFIHELGHNMRLPHANTCFRDQTISLNGSCVDIQYGDSTDPMGNAWNVDRLSFGAEFLTRIGWLPQTNQSTWTGNTTNYTLVPLDDTRSSGLRGIRINARGALDGNAPGDYWLQFRAFSENSYPKSGVHLTLSPTEEFELSTTGGNSIYGPSTWLCDLTPTNDQWGLPGWDSFGFVPNVPWTDPSGLFTVTVTSVTATSATLTIAPAQKLPAPLIAVTAEPLVTDSTPDGRVKISWVTPSPVVSPEFGEPVAVVSTIDGTRNRCIAVARERSCIITGAPRNQEFSVTTAGRNYSGDSTGTSVRLSVIPTAPPTGIMASTSTSTSVTLSISIIDDGGAPVLSTGAVTLSNGKACARGVNPCTISGLIPRASYIATSRLENIAGVRGVSTNFVTLSQTPAPPTVTARLVENSPTATVAVQTIDTFNVDSVAFWCQVEKEWRETPYEGVPITLKIADAVSYNFCWVYTQNRVGRSAGVLIEINSLTDKPTTNTIQTESDKDSDSGKDINSGTDDSTSVPVISAKVVRLKGGGRVRITWSVTDGDASLVTVSKIAGRTCRRTGRNTCVASNVRRGRIRVTLAMPGAQKITLRTPR